tara:strand:+ start:148385 stop:149260 length:876 start_codon:yes stop_codon:yes gene_type:complete
MNLRDLQYFISVAEHNHFGKAAKASFVSQPALSMQLKKLEEELGVELFERTNKSVMITPVGKEILVRAKSILQTSKEIKEVALTYQDPFAGPLKLGAFPTLAPYYLPKIIPHISKLHKDLRLFLIEEKTDILIEQLTNGDIDAAFLALPVQNENLECIELFSDEFYLATASNHSYANKKSLSLNDLKGDCLLLLKDGHCLRNQALDVCSLTGMCVQQDFQATSLETLRQMVANNIGMTLMPKIAMQKNDGLSYIKFSQNPPSRKIGLFFRKTSPRKACIESIAKIIKNLVK